MPLLLVAVSALALGMGATQPSINSLISRRAGTEQQGEVMGVAQSVGSLSRVLGPIVAGALFAGFGRNSAVPLGGGAGRRGAGDRLAAAARRRGASRRATAEAGRSRE